VPLLLEGLFPAALQLAGHEPVLRLTRLYPSALRILKSRLTKRRRESFSAVGER
jgi:hypothetical protein